MIQIANTIERYNKIILTELKEAGIVAWVAGGAVRDYFMGVPIKTDIDLFFPNEKEYQKASVYFKAKEAVIKWESDHGMKVKYNGKTYDLVKHFFDGPQQTIDAFDFTVAMFAVDTERVYFGETSFMDLAKRQLMINKLPFPASTMSRAFRYYTKGFRMCSEEMKKLVLAIQEMPKTEPREQSEDEENPSSGDGFFKGID